MNLTIREVEELAKLLAPPWFGADGWELTFDPRTNDIAILQVTAAGSAKALEVN